MIFQDLKSELPKLLETCRLLSQSATFSPRLVAYLEACCSNIEGALHVMEDASTMKAALEADAKRPKMRDVLNIPTRNPKI